MLKSYSKSETGCSSVFNNSVDMKKIKPLPRVGELEQQVLEYLWKSKEADVQETHSAVGVPRGITLNTVGSALERLNKKKLVAREKVSHAFRYRPILSRDTFMARSMMDAAGGLKALGDQGILTAFVDLATDAGEDTLNELEQLIRIKKEQNK